MNVGKDKLPIALQLTSTGDSANIHLLYSRGYCVMEFVFVLLRSKFDGMTLTLAFDDTDIGICAVTVITVRGRGCRMLTKKWSAEGIMVVGVALGLLAW